ncbi:MAG: radical SAM protein [Methylococcales bacterium]|nr:radical SAM protein [Methylococcales bacterium]
MIVFGPVPSRRLGRSLGINNIPPKHCSYSCVYCQVGSTKATEIESRVFYQPEHVFNEVKTRVMKLKEQQESIDYITFVPDGEPTLDNNLGKTIVLLRDLGIKIAIITNSSLIWRKKVRETLQLADWVSLKIDSVNQSIWQRINQPNKHLNLQEILSNILSFADDFDGFLATETMLLEGLNTDDSSIAELVGFLQQLAPDKAYLAIPTRPTAEQGVNAPDADVLNHIYQTVNQSISEVELLTGYEGNAFASSGDLVNDLLAITAVHPMRKEAVQILLEKTKTNWDIVRKLIEENKLREIEYNGNTFYLRAYKRKIPNNQMQANRDFV